MTEGKPDWQRRIDSDMAQVPTMTLPEALGLLDGYSHRTFGDEIGRGDLLVDQVRAYADQALGRVWASVESAQFGDGGRR